MGKWNISSQWTSVLNVRIHLIYYDFYGLESSSKMVTKQQRKIKEKQNKNIHMAMEKQFVWTCGYLQNDMRYFTAHIIPNSQSTYS